MESVYQKMIPLILYGHVVVAVLLYQDTRYLSVRLLALMGLIAECLPPGVLNLVNGPGMEVGIPLANSPRALSPEMVAAQPYPTASCTYRHPAWPMRA